MITKIFWSTNGSYVPTLDDGEKHYWVRYYNQEEKRRKVLVAASSPKEAKRNFIEDFPYSKFNRVVIPLGKFKVL